MSVETADRGLALDVIKSEFDFEVNKFPLSGPDNMKTPFYGLFRSDDMSAIGGGSVSKIYVPHQTDDVLALVESAIEAFDCPMKVDCGFNAGHYVNLAPTNDQRRAIFKSNDNIFPRVYIRAGYDGKSFQASLGFYRDACSNLSMLRSVNACHVSIRHTSGLRSQMDSLIKQFALLKESWSTLGSVVEHMQSATVDVADFLTTIYGQPTEVEGRSRTVHENRTRAIVKRIVDEGFRTGRDRFTGQASAWEAFNAVQGYVQHDSSRKGDPNAFDRVILASNDAAVRKAEATALASLSV
jgi:hypothetical protein